MALVFAVTLILFLFSGVLLMLMLNDLEVQKRMFRRYMQRLDRDGILGLPIGWLAMKFSPFVRPAWFFRLPKPSERPDLYNYSELVEVMARIDRNRFVIKRILLVFLPSALIMGLNLARIAGAAE